MFLTEIGEDAVITKEPKQVLGGKTPSSSTWFAWIKLTSRRQKNGNFIEGWINTAHLKKQAASPSRASNKNSPSVPKRRSSVRTPKPASSAIPEEHEQRVNKDLPLTAISSARSPEPVTLVNPEKIKRQQNVQIVLLRAVLKVFSPHRSHQHAIYPHQMHIHVPQRKCLPIF